MNSILAFKLYSMMKSGNIKTNVHFGREFSKEKVENFDIDISNSKNELQEKGLNVIYVFDKQFPKLDNKLKNSENPFLFVYKRNINLISNCKNNEKQQNH